MVGLNSEHNEDNAEYTNSKMYHSSDALAVLPVTLYLHYVTHVPYS